MEHDANGKRKPDICGNRKSDTSGVSSFPPRAVPGCWLGVCQWINISHLGRPHLRDESDNHLAELAVAGNAAWIVTGNARDVAEGELVFDGFQVVTPGEWLKGDN